MRKARWTAVATFAVVMLAAGCGSENADDKAADGAKSSATQVADKPARTAPAQGTLVERAAGTWKSIVSPSDNSLDTLVVEDGKVTAKGTKLSCTGTLKPEKKDGKETATITYTCEGGKDGDRGLGHVKLSDDASKLAIAFDGPSGGWGGPVDSYRRA
ncbi:hypothetical protein [Streptomyces thermodiastaticus]|uniref:hypothetical protein n=1 Tax=Streptomyces thermodiastaticus TaxID=44061 RepID=UPI001674141E|nr:hypothetical protein [Streptomyces thermodiastaticus]MCE7551933.1 hypothetical protein [Streptomyces thermodiastaticus]GHF79087.1 hypothetical protein GCM10018787_29800 [Streptomyces thermodiastaticus]